MKILKRVFRMQNLYIRIIWKIHIF